MTNTKKTFSLSQFIRLFKDAFIELGKNDPLRMAGATAFFTTFALPPILIIIIQALGLFFDPEKIRGQLFDQLSTIIGRASVLQVVEVLKAFSDMAKNWWVTIGGFIFLLFVATTLFKVIKSSLNQVWKIRVFKRRSLLKQLTNRLMSVLVILLAGLLFTVGLLAEGAQAILGNYLIELVPGFAPYFNSGLNHFLSIVIVTIWFAVVFRYLPDARPQWDVILTGALVTSVLFNIGKIVIRWLLTYSNINTVYGASGSIILLLLFVFYSSLILYYGAAFTRIWSIHHNQPIKPKPYARHYKLAETEED